MINTTKNLEYIDQETLEQINELQMEGEPDILVEVIESFLNSTPKRIKSIEELIKNNNLDAVSKEAHALKSSSFTLGAKKLGELCQKLENLKTVNKNTSVEELFNSLKLTHQKSCDELLYIKIEQEKKIN